jgi:hypothetical protein
MNLCRPDNSKSCAACCGLYNVTDGTRPTLQSKLDARTNLFRTVDRTPDALNEYEEHIRSVEHAPAHDAVIHVCEFSGFVDPHGRSVGCMLHPSASGNAGIDLRGMCHYGSMACKSFYCPAWTELPLLHRNVITEIIDDWYLYGLVITDVNFVLSLFRLVEQRLRKRIDPSFLNRRRARRAFLTMLQWKDTWPLSGNSSTRLSRYYVNDMSTKDARDGCGEISRLVESLRFTFDTDGIMNGADEMVMAGIEEFVQCYEPA